MKGRASISHAGIVHGRIRLPQRVTMEPISIAHAIGEAANLSARVFTSLYKYCRGVKNAPLRSRELRDEIFAISNVLDELCAIHENASALGLCVEGSLAKLAAMLKELEIRITVPKGNSLKRLKWPFTERETEEYLFKTQRLVTTFNLALHTLQRYPLYPLYPNLAGKLP
jgi:hypothetical protein